MPQRFDVQDEKMENMKHGPVDDRLGGTPRRDILWLALASAGAPGHNAAREILKG
jgi:hypothetical protein